MDASCNIVDLISCFSAESHTLHRYDSGFVSFLASFWNDVVISETSLHLTTLSILLAAFWWILACRYDSGTFFAHFFMM
jgi:hypothetical protein